MTSSLLFYTNDETTCLKGCESIVKYFGEKVRVHLKDGRCFHGILCMADNRGHLVLQGDISWPSSSSHPGHQQQPYRGKMGTVAIAPEFISKIERKLA